MAQVEHTFKRYDPQCCAGKPAPIDIGSLAVVGDRSTPGFTGVVGIGKQTAFDRLELGANGTDAGT